MDMCSVLSTFRFMFGCLEELSFVQLYEQTEDRASRVMLSGHVCQFRFSRHPFSLDFAFILMTMSSH